MLKPENNDEKVTSFENKGFNALKNKKQVRCKVVKVVDGSDGLKTLVLESVKNDTLDLKAQALSKLDKTFQPQSFMSWAKNTFESIFKDFYLNRNEKIKTITTDAVYNAFKSFNDDLSSKKQTINAEIIRFKSVRIKDIKVSKKKADIILEFVTEQTAVIKDSAGKILKGDDNQIETITDVWCFSRDYSKKKSNWILSETIEA